MSAATCQKAVNYTCGGQIEPDTMGDVEGDAMYSDVKLQTAVIARPLSH